ESKFKEINEAYEVLKDPSKRQRYDQFGHAGVGGGPAGHAGGPNPFEGFAGFDGQNIHFDFGDGGLGDIFSQFFGGSSSPRQRRQRRGRDIEVAVNLEFEEAIFGSEKTLGIRMEEECSHCKG